MNWSRTTTTKGPQMQTFLPGRPVMAPSVDLADALTAREHWHALEPVLLVLNEDGHLDFATAVSWLASPAEALDGLSAAQWVSHGRDRERLLLVARRDAWRFAQ
jgi:hypothetical protein